MITEEVRSPSLTAKGVALQTEDGFTHVNSTSESSTTNRLESRRTPGSLMVVGALEEPDDENRLDALFHSQV